VKRVPISALILFVSCTLLSIVGSPAFAQSSTATNSDVVIFSPAAKLLNNPTTSGGITPASEFTIKVNAFDRQGHALLPTIRKPLHLEVYGAPEEVITPSSTTITSGNSATFTYNGEFFPNNIVINAWISDRWGDAIGVAQLLQANKPEACIGTQDYSVPLVSPFPGALQIRGSVGYTTPYTGKAHLKKYTIDTGSLGVIVTANDLPQKDTRHSSVIGPAGEGVKCYDSSNKAYFGHYYFAPVDIEVISGSTTTTVQTNPIIVLGAEEYCKVSNCTELKKISCSEDSPIHYMGVGFDRNATAAGDLFDSPAENAFLHVTDADNGTNINPGYILSPSDQTTTTGVTLGINSTAGYNLINLSANTNVPGDWNAQPACYGFPDLRTPNQFCGTGLLDVGISEMFIDLPFAKRPAKTFDSNDKVPADLLMNILMGNRDAPAMSYQYTTVQPPTSPSGPAPTYSQWINTTSKPAAKQVFVNTGRNPLNSFDYLYEGQCGNVGFKALP
jgi:hypothetical protein